MGNIFDLPLELPQEELFEILFKQKNLLIERIVSSGQVTEKEQWYNQEQDEWVILLQGKATLTYGDSSTIDLKAGDYVLIPAYQKHRVEYTSTNPPCIWLAIHVYQNS